MAELSLQLPGKVFFGSDVLNLAGTLTAAYGTRAILISEYLLHEGRHIEKVQDILRKRGIECIVVDDMGSQGLRRDAAEVVDYAKASRIQVVIGLGGMKILSQARRIACLSAAGDGADPHARPLPYIEIPTVFRNPLLMSDAYLETDPASRRPRIVRAPEGLVRVALVDPSLTVTLSPKYAGALFLDSVLGALEGYISGGANFLSDALFLAALKLLGEGIDDAVRGVKDLRPRVKASQAGVLSAMGLATCSSGAGSALSYAINALFGTPKSWVGAVLLPHIMDLHLGSRADKLAETAKALGEDIFGLGTADAAACAPVRTRRVIAQLGLPGRLRDFDLKLSELVDAAEAASGFDPKNGLPMTVDALYDLLKRAY